MNSTFACSFWIVKLTIIINFLSIIFITNLSANTIDVVLVGYEEKKDYNDNPTCEMEFSFGNNAWGTMYQLAIDSVVYDDRGDKMPEYAFKNQIVAFDMWSSTKSMPVGSALTSKSLEVEGRCKYIQDIYLKEVKPEKCNVRMMPEDADCLEIINPISRIDHINLINEFSTVAAEGSTNPGLEPLYFADEFAVMGDLMFDQDPTIKKTLGTNIGREIRIDDFYVWSYNDNRYISGGPLELWSDDSMGTDTRITCTISPNLGDQFMKNNVRQALQIEGRIKSYTEYDGLIIEPCDPLNELQ